MKSTMSVWSRSLNRLLGTSRSTETQRKTGRRTQSRRLVLESLERREVFSVDLISAISIGNATGNSNAADIAIDTAGNSFMTGSFSGTVDFDPTSTHAGDTDILTARGSSDAFVAKYASDNSLIWAKRMGGDSIQSGSNDACTDISIDGSGNVYVGGQFFGSSDFGAITLVSTGGDRDGFVAKLNSSGTVQWANRWGAIGDDFSSGVDVDAAGNVYSLGIRYYADTYDVRKYTPSGASVWTKSIVTNGRFGAELEVDTSGNVFVAGDFHGRVDFDPGSKTNYVYSSQSYTSYSGFVLKLTNAGKFNWVSPFVGQSAGSLYGTSYVMSIALDGNGNVIVGGSYSGPVDFNPGAATTILPTGGRGFITKLNNNGGLVWAKALESNNTTFVNSLAVDSFGSIYATGSFYGTVDFDPGAGTASRTNAGGSDVFVVKLNSAGNLGWVESFGGTGDDGGSGIAVDNDGDVYLAGYYQGTVDFDSTNATYNLTNPGAFRNAFRLRLRQL